MKLLNFDEDIFYYDYLDEPEIEELLKPLDLNKFLDTTETTEYEFD